MSTSGPQVQPQAHTHPRLIIHGGAGAIHRSSLPPPAYANYRTSLLSVLSSTHALLISGASALSAATHAVRLLEDNPLFNCGRGAVFTRTGEIELEASVMVSRGWRKRGVGVGGLRGVRHPVELAREVLVRGGGDEDGGEGVDGGGAQAHNFLWGETAEGLARGWGLEMKGPEWFWTRKRWDEHLRGLEREKQELERDGRPELDMDMDMGLESQGDRGEEKTWATSDEGWDGKEYLPQGTVGCVCLDRYGVLAVATSTGGLTNKLPGRVGDTPTLGAGFWAEKWKEAVRENRSERVWDSIKQGWKHVLNLGWGLDACFPAAWGGFIRLPVSDDDDVELENKCKDKDNGVRAVAMSGTGNGDYFLRLSAVRTAAAIARFSSPHQNQSLSLASAVTKVAGPGGELQQSAASRWGMGYGDGEGGIIGIELVRGQGKVVADFNCGGLFRAWVDEGGTGRMRVFREEYEY